jgi:hypothetical protein
VRRLYIVLILAAVVIFFGVSALLARVFSAEGAERSAITALITSEAAGKTDAMLQQIDGCPASRPCRARVAHDAATLKRPGAVKIILQQSSAGFSLVSTLGVSRVAWNAGDSLPVVQCVKVRRAGNVVSGLHVQLLAITAKLNGSSGCPPRFY